MRSRCNISKDNCCVNPAYGYVSEYSKKWLAFSADNSCFCCCCWFFYLYYIDLKSWYIILHVRTHSKGHPESMILVARFQLSLHGRRLFLFRFATLLPSIMDIDTGCTGKNFRRFVNTRIRIQILYEPDEEVQKAISRVCYINYN